MKDKPILPEYDSLTVRITPQQRETLKQISKRMGLSMGELMRRAWDKFAEQQAASFLQQEAAAEKMEASMARLMSTDWDSVDIQLEIHRAQLKERQQRQQLQQATQ